jgi:hypothetical protein
MRLKLVRGAFAEDALSAPDPQALALQRYNEWHHFAFRDDGLALSGIVNLALSGDVRDGDRGLAVVSLLVHEEAAARWHGTMNVYASAEARYAAGAVDLAIARSSVRFTGGAYTVRARLKDRSVEIDTVWKPRAEAVRIDGMGGFLGTFIVPVLGVEGTVRIGGRTFELAGASGYHDHNWGAWEWSRDLGWSWGYLHSAASERATAIVFGQVTDAAGVSARTEPVVLVWRDAALSHVFLDRAVTVRAFGRLDADVPRVPGVMALLSPGRAGSVPERLAVDVSEHADGLRIEGRVRHGLEILIPHAAGSGHTSVAELAADLSVAGVLDGEPVAFACRAFAELAAAARTEPLPRVRIGV